MWHGVQRWRFCIKRRAVGTNTNKRGGGVQEEAEDVEEAVVVATAFLHLMRRVLERCRAAGDAQLRAVRESLAAAFADCRAGLVGTLRDTPASYDELLITVRPLPLCWRFLCRVLTLPPLCTLQDHVLSAFQRFATITGLAYL